VWNGKHLPSQDIVPHSARGAFEAGLRAGTLGSWEDGAASLLSPLSDRRVVSAGVAVGWILSTLTRMSLAYDVTATDGWSRVREHALMLRVQQAF
jgi:hypothetical protein